MASQLQSLADPILAARAFLPTSLPGLHAWLECGDATNIYCHEVTTVNDPCEDGDACKGWQDRGGSNRHMTEVTNGPTYQAPIGGETQPNGQGRIEFDGVNDVLTAATQADWKSLHDGTGMTVFVAVKTPNEVIAPVIDTTNDSVGIGIMLFNDDAGAEEGRASVVVRNGGGNIILGQAVAGSNACPAGEWHLWCAQWTPNIGIDLYIDDCFILRAFETGIPSTANPAIALQIGKGTGGAFVANKYGAILHYRSVLTPTQRRQVAVNLGQKHGIAIGNVACIGDSITAGGLSAPVTYPMTLAKRLGALWRADNFGISGAVVNDAAGVDVYNDQWTAAAGVKRRRYNHVVCMAGVNDLRNTADSASTIMERYDDLLDSVLAEPDMKLVLCTVMPIKGVSLYDAALQLRLDTFNQLLRDYAAAHNRCYILETGRTLSNPEDRTALNPAYDLDHLHPNQTGTDVLAAMVADKLLEIGLTVPSCN